MGGLFIFVFSETLPTAEEFSSLTNAVGWGIDSKAVVEQALNGSVYTVSVYDGNKIIGFGRLIGDRAMFLYIQDVMVLPEYQGRQIGTRIMERLIDKINECKKFNPDLRAYLGASKGKEGFYERFGFVTRESAGLGAGMVLF